ncbi:MAG: hypothetical protein IPK88_06540 [Saprospiraceae bacterium]|jgi:hypothetical protein|nr:hypothetical protein [Candidatus Defluviibacterium haderslevense]
MNTELFTKNLFNKLEVLLGEKNWKSKTAQLLNISSDAFYKKIRNESQLNLHELLLIKDTFKISIDALLDESNLTAIFDCSEVMVPKTSYVHYLENILLNFVKTSNLKDIYVYYTSNEISLFQYFQFPYLSAFKLFIWAKTNWDIPTNVDLKTEINTLVKNEKVQDLLKNITSYYNSFPSTEIWSINILDNTLNQLKWFIESGELTNKELLNLIINDLEDLIQRNKTIMKNGIKLPNPITQKDTPFKVYFNEMTHTNNTILLKHSTGLITFITHDNPNFLSTTSERFGDFTNHWIQKLINKSENISGESEKSRNKYFSILEKKLEKFKNNFAIS